MPAIPMIFMGQELLEDNQWSNNPVWPPGNLILWDGLNFGRNSLQTSLHRFIEALVCHCNHAGQAVGPVIVFHHSIPGFGQDIVVVASLNGTTWRNYELPLAVRGPLERDIQQRRV